MGSGKGRAARVRGLDGMAVTRSAWGLYRETRRPGAPGPAARVRALPRLLRDALAGRYPGVGPGKLAALTLAVGVYLVSPVDAVPDFLPLLGWGDDTALLLWFLMGLTRESGRYVEWTAGRAATNGSEVARI